MTVIGFFSQVGKPVFETTNRQVPLQAKYLIYTATPEITFAYPAEQIRE